MFIFSFEYIFLKFPITALQYNFILLDERAFFS